MNNKKEVKDIASKYRNIVLLSISVIAILLCVGTTYGWFSTSITGAGTKTATIITDQLKLIYTDDLSLTDHAIDVDWSTTRTFTVQNISGQTLNYKIMWNDLVNTFVTNYLQMTITSTNGGGTFTKAPIQKSATASDYTIINSVSIPANTTQTYTVTFEYPNADEDQNDDMGQEFSGTIEIVGI